MLIVKVWILILGMVIGLSESTKCVIRKNKCVSRCPDSKLSKKH